MTVLSEKVLHIKENTTYNFPMISLGRKRIFSNIFLQFVGKFLSIIFSLINISFLTRVLSGEGYGEYVTVFAYLGLFSMIGNFGMDKILIKKIVKLRQQIPKIEEFLGNALFLRFILMFFASLLAIFISFLLPYSHTLRMGILIVSLTFIFDLAALIFVDYFQSMLQFGKSIIIDTFANKGTQTLLILTLAVFGFHSTLIFLATSFFAGFISFLVGLYLINKKGIALIIPRFRYQLSKKFLIASFPLAITVFLDQAKKVDILLLSFFSGTQAVGIYGLADKIFENAILPSTLIFSVFFPVVVERIEDKQFLKKFKKIIIFLIILSIIFSAFLFQFSPLVIRILAGDKFYESINLLRIFCLSIIFQYLLTPLFYLLIVKGRQAYLAKAQFLSTFFNITLNFLVIPKFSYTGAAVVRVFSLFLLLTILLWSFKRNEVSHS